MEEETNNTNEPVVENNSVLDPTDPTDPIDPTDPTDFTDNISNDSNDDQSQNDLTVDNTEQEIQESTEDPNAYNQIYSDQLELTNHLIAGQIFFMGLLFGVLLFKIFWDRWKI